MSSGRISVLFFCMVTFFLPGSVLGAEVDRGLDRSWPMLTVEDQVWVGTCAGLFRYDVSEDAWLVFTPREGLCDWSPGLLGLDQDILWVGTEHGLCNADIRLFDWESFDTTRGLPSNEVLALAFEEDYVWVGTAAGAVRYDPLVEEIESFSGERVPEEVRVYDIAVEKGTVWLATEEGVWEFSLEHETWRVHTEAQGLPSRIVRRIITGAGGLWFITDAGLARFDAALRTWFSYRSQGLSRINDVAIDGSSIWLATNHGVFFYDMALDQWRVFQELQSLGIQEINSISLTQGQIWMATEIGVARFDQSTKTWTLYTVDNGLSSNRIKTVRYWHHILFATSDIAIDYYKEDEDRWYSQRVESLKSVDEFEKAALFSLGGSEGTVFRPSQQVTMRLLGRASYQYERMDEWELPGDGITSLTETQGRTHLVLASNLGGNRSANAFYDDTQYDRELEYGLRYHGAEDDFLREISLGDMRWDLGRGELLPTLGVFGGGARVEAGPRTTRMRRRRVAVAAGGGDQTTDFQTDFFTGLSSSGSGSLADNQYMKWRFFSLTDEVSTLPIRLGSERIYLDDGVQTNNTLNTRTNWSIAGINGDFDLLNPTEDYSLDEMKGMLDLHGSISASSFLVAVFELIDEVGEREVVLFGGDVDRSLVNRYFLGAPEILPQTLFLSILDTLGVEHALSDYGLDADRDGAVDGQYLDSYHGILHFPGLRPFPDSVYSSENPRHLYTLQFSYQTSSTTFWLSHQDIISESERVEVDGKSLRRGEDYIVDYSSGSLLFLDEGLIELNSRVKVEYEYSRQSEDRLESLVASYSPSDLLSTAISAARYYPQEEDSSLGRVDLLHATGELRMDEGPAGLDVLLVSEAARTAAAGAQGSAGRIKTSAKSDLVRVSAELERYDEAFISLRPQRTVLGQLIQRARVEVQREWPSLFMLEAGWSSEKSLDGEGKSAVEEMYQASGVLNKKGYPSLVLSLSRRLDRGSSPFPDRTSIRGNLEYQVPASWISAVKLHSLKVTSYLHRGWEDGVDSTYNPASQKTICQGEYIRLDIAPEPSFQLATSLRRDWRKTRFAGIDNGYRAAGEEGEAIFTTNCDAFSGLSLYARLEGNCREDVLSGAERLRAYSLDRQRQVTARIYPGFWQHSLTPVTLQLDYIHSWGGHLEGLSGGLGFWERYWSVLSRDELMAGEEFRSGQIRGEVRPSSSINLSMGLERRGQNIRLLKSLLQYRIWEYTSKLEMRRGSSVLVLNFLRDESEKVGISSTIENAPTVWWECRWSRGLITKVSFFFWREKLREGKIEEISSALSPRLGITCRWPELWIFGAVEVVDDVSLTLSQWDGPELETSSRVLGNSLKLDIKPLPLALLRLQSQVSHTHRQSARDLLHHDFSLKLTLQF